MLSEVLGVLNRKKQGKEKVERNCGQMRKGLVMSKLNSWRAPTLSTSSSHSIPWPDTLASQMPRTYMHVNKCKCTSTSDLSSPLYSWWTDWHWQTRKCMKFPSKPSRRSLVGPPITIPLLHQPRLSACWASTSSAPATADPGPVWAASESPS